MILTAERPRIYVEGVCSSYSDTADSAADRLARGERELRELVDWVCGIHVSNVHTPHGQTTGVSHISLDANSSAAGEPDDLVDALMDLHEIRLEARRNGNAGPSDETVRHAEGVLRALYNSARQAYGVYPMTDGDIAIDVPSPFGTKLLVVCDADGSARCLGFVKDEHRVYEYSDPRSIPDRNFMETWRRVLIASV
jgi:hypothetical protein